MESLIKTNKPNISSSTLKTYLSLLKSLYYKSHDKSKEIHLAWFNDQDAVIESLKDKPASSRKTTYAALIAIAEHNNKYKQALIEDGKSYDEFIKTQTKTETQKNNWKNFTEIKHIYESMHAKIKPLLNSKTVLSDKEYKQLQDFIILSLTSGYWIPPRRSLDWCFMKIKNIDKEHGNYIEKRNFVFNKYKTAKFYNTQTVAIPAGLKLILNKFIKHNKHDWLLTDDAGNQLTNVRLAQKLNRIFGANISTSMLRHIYLTDKLRGTPSLADLESTATAMGHSVGEAMEYAKRD